jgi:hypothetical protein
MGSSLPSLPAPNGKPKLLDQVRNEIRVRHMARSTEKVYVSWIRRFILYHGKRHPGEMGKNEVTAFLTHLAVAGNVSASTQNQAFSALLFLYREVLKQEFGWLNDVVRANRPGRIPVVLTHHEAVSVLSLLDGVNWLIAACDRAEVSERHISLGLAVRVSSSTAVARSTERCGAAASYRSHEFWACGEAGGTQSRDQQTCHGPRFAPFFRDSATGEGPRYPHGAGTAGAPRRPDDADLHACAAK